MRFATTERQYIYTLHISVVVVSALLGSLILTDIRINILGEPFGDYLMAMGIAISRVVYNINGMAGLEQVLEILKQIPNVSLISLDGGAAYEGYHQAINEALQKATLLNDINPSQLHAYVNDQGYLYYVMLAFALFGIKIQSLSYFWLLLFNASVLSFLVAYKRSLPSLLLLWCLIVSITLIVISNPGIGSQIITMYNYRFIPVLGLIPLLHIVLAANRPAKGLFAWSAIWLQIILFVFILLARGSAQWMLIAIVISVAYLLWSKRKKSSTAKNTSKNTSVIEMVRSSITPLIFVLFTFLVASSTMPQFLYEGYKEKLWAQTHVVWHAAVIGLTTDPVLMSTYVCSDESLTDRLKGFEQLQCDNAPRRYPRLVYDIFNEPRDMHGYQAAVKYLRSRGSEEQIGSKNVRADYFNINWERYEEIMRYVYFDMLRQNPVDILYMYVIAKPLKYVKDAVMYSTYIVKGIRGAQSSFGIWAILLIIFLLHTYLLRGFRSVLAQATIIVNHEVGLLGSILLLIFISSTIPSMLFYSQSHTIADSVAILLTLVLFLHIVATTRKYSKRSAK